MKSNKQTTNKGWGRAKGNLASHEHFHFPPNNIGIKDTCRLGFQINDHFSMSRVSVLVVCFLAALGLVFAISIPLIFLDVLCFLCDGTKTGFKLQNKTLFRDSTYIDILICQKKIVNEISLFSCPGQLNRRPCHSLTH